MRILSIIILAIVGLSGCNNPQEGPANKKMDRFVNDLMKEMTLQEKIGQLNLVTQGGGVPTGSAVSTDVEARIKEGKVGGVFGVVGPEKVRQAQELAVTQSRLKIPLLFGLDVIHGYKTTFPIPLGLSCSWDMGLIGKTARVAGNEATADGLCWTFSPMVDIARDPRWGRVAEGSGEDPYLGSQIAKAMVGGYQGTDLSQNNTMMATVKHFALYGGAEAGRDYNTVDMSRQRMYNEYLPPYKAAVEAGAGSVMSSFNDVDGIPATGNRWLLTDLLRNSWGFDGFVVSDYTSVSEMTAHGLGDLQGVSTLALKAGLDMDMVSEGFLNTLQKSLDEAKVTQKEINQACRRILEAKYKLGLFDDPYRYIDETRPSKEILTPENRLVAREVAARSFVLLKNDHQVLPLKKAGSVALIGPLANNKNNMLGTWAVAGDPQNSIPVLEGLENVAGSGVKILYAKGANISDDTVFTKKINVFGERIDLGPQSPEIMLNEAVRLARQSDVVVAVVGEASEMTGESASRSGITLPESQKKLINALKNTGKPLVLVLMTGRPLAIPEETEISDAILLTWFPGIEAGNAIADVLFGDVNPSGKLTITFPRNGGQIPIYYRIRNTGRPSPTGDFTKFVSNYLDVPNSPLFPFGFGLSYSKFEYKNLSIDKKEPALGDTLMISVEITNTGNFDGQEIAQLYIRDKVASVTRPLKELKGFQKITLKKGETLKVDFPLPTSELGFYDNSMNYTVEPGEFEVFVGGNSVDLLSTTLFITDKKVKISSGR